MFDFWFFHMALYLRSKSTKLVAQQCHWHRCDMHSGVTDTTTSVKCTAVSLTPLCNQLCRKFSLMILNTVFLCGIMIRLHTAQQCYWHRCDMHSGVIDTAVQIWQRSDFGYHIRVALATFNGNISIEKTYMGKFIYTISITFTQKI
jgi:hypothetical protein